jgi:GMP synthase-like glutamine amidotransferase
LVGICFGAQIIAQALGGQVEKMPMFNGITGNQLPIFIGKESIDLREEFF